MAVVAAGGLLNVGRGEDDPSAGRNACPTSVVHFEVEGDTVAVLAGERPLATIVLRDEAITRPYMAHVFEPGGVQISRHHPPRDGIDAIDHATFHPGIWLAFGDIGGNDYWRLAARVESKLVGKPESGEGVGRLTLSNRYLSADGKKTVCGETCRLTIVLRDESWLLLWDSTFTSPNGEFAFGDQEEMGLGMRLATPLAVAGGGRIKNSRGDENERGAWGKSAEWCEYSGVVEGRRVGLVLMPHPANFRPSWFHVRDYGLMVANPFGRRAMTGGEVSSVAVPKGESLRLRFGVLVYGHDDGKEPDFTAALRDYLDAANDQTDKR